MLENIATALYGSPVSAILASFIWGIFSVLLSPCHLSSIPLVIGYINRQEGLKPRDGFLIGLFFSLGILVTLVLIAILSFLVGILLGPVQLIFQIFVSLLLFLAGLYFLELLPFNIGMEMIDRGITKHRYWNGFYLGILLGVGLGVCALAFMAPVLSISISSFESMPLFSIGLVMAFIIGHCGIIAGAGGFLELIKKLLRWNNQSSGTTYIRKISGIILIIAGIFNVLKNVF
ncbi:MAG: cytochrome c biogenesis protein CcdA [Candidatus Cloacimonetes bacterium]|nr:cytochrome c biogenesis protein CcdA [Candidatus Cloacimonadota bacterium]